MLKDDFYSIIDRSKIDESSFMIRISLKTDHPIFEGHFPGFPVVPGVCMMAIVKETLNDHLGKSFILQNANNLKFLSLINPTENSDVDVHIKYSEGEDKMIVVDASILDGERVFFKMVKAVYK